MLIIFDLDDTLIDTSGSYIPAKLQQALQEMIQHGLVVDSEEEAYQLLLGLNETAPNGAKGLQEFLQEVGGHEKFLEIGTAAYYGPRVPNVPLQRLPRAVAVLEKLRQQHTLALVSYGVKEAQLQKMKLAGISGDLFSTVLFTDQYDKQECYQKLCAQFGYQPENVLVCGDKFKTDLAPAITLGMKVVHMLWGRGIKDKPPTVQSIRDLSLLPQLIEELQCKQ